MTEGLSLRLKVARRGRRRPHTYRLRVFSRTPIEFLGCFSITYTFWLDKSTMSQQQDDISELLMIGSYGGGRTLSGPDEVLTRKIRASQSTPVGTDVFSTLNFRILGSSGAGRNLMRSRVKLCMPLSFDQFAYDNVATGAAVTDRDIRDPQYSAVGPRRSGGLQCFRQISTVVNNSASFSVQVGETLCQLDDAFLPANACGEGRREDSYRGTFSVRWTCQVTGSQPRVC